MNRLQALFSIIREKEADAMLLTGEVTITYITGETALEGTCLVFSDDTAVFITDGRYIEVAESMLTPKGFMVVCTTTEKNGVAHIREQLALHDVKTLLFEDDDVTVKQFGINKGRYDIAEWLPLDSAINVLRACKSQEEIDCIVHAQRIAEDAFAALLPELTLGITEKQAAARLDYLMAMRGSEKPSFDTIILFGENSSKPHGVPSDRPLQSGDIILADFGAVWHGYHSDMTRTLAFGSVTDEIRRVYEIVLQAQQAAFDAAREGELCSKMHEAAENVIAEAGYGKYFTHALGHSVGLEIHEYPSASPRCSEPLQNGIVMTDEPGIYLAGKFGIRIEDMVLIQGNTPQNLTQFPKHLQIIGVSQADL